MPKLKNYLLTFNHFKSQTIYNVFLNDCEQAKAREAFSECIW